MRICNDPSLFQISGVSFVPARKQVKRLLFCKVRLPERSETGQAGAAVGRSSQSSQSERPVTLSRETRMPAISREVIR